MPTILAIGGVLAAAAAAAGDAVTVCELASDFSWGYRCGLKQPVGTYRDGLSLHQITDNNNPAGEEGNPDHVFWVDEVTGEHGIAQYATGALEDFVHNPGGMMSFGPDGTIWFAHGAHYASLPLGLYSSLQPADPTAFAARLEAFDTDGGSTTPCVTVHGDKLLLVWRHGTSSGVNTTVRVRRYDVGGDFAAPELELDLGKGMSHELLGPLGIEQLWTRFDPRFGYTIVTWQNYWTEAVPGRFGALPLLYTDDDGATWRSVDGTARSELPLAYEDIDEVLVAYNHFAHNDDAGWLPADVGVSPDGVFWMTLRDRFDLRADFWRFDGTSWTSTPMAEIVACMPFACGVTQDLIVFAYAEESAPHVLQARTSADDGATWSAPIVLDVLEPGQVISWVSYVQPAVAYEDNSARFFYGYAQNGNVAPLRYRNSIRWVRLDADLYRPADLDGDGEVGILDFLALLQAWGPCADCFACPADLDADCQVMVTDLLILLADWG